MAKTKTTPPIDPPITLRSDRQRDTWQAYSDGLRLVHALEDDREGIALGQPVQWLLQRASLHTRLDAVLHRLVSRGPIAALLAVDLDLTAAGSPDPARLAWLLRWAEFDGDEEVTRQQVSEVSGASLVTVQRWATSTDAPRVQGRAVEGGGALTYRAGDWAAWTPPATGRPGGQR